MKLILLFLMLVVSTIILLTVYHSLFYSNIPVAGITLFGGLGNRLFQLAFIYAYCRTHNVRIYITNPKHTSQHSSNSYDYLTTRFKALPNYNEGGCNFVQTLAERPEREWTHIRFPRILENTLFFGYFQHVGYLKDFVSELQHLFRSPFPVDSKDAYFLHIRLGDMVSIPESFLGDEYITKFISSSLASIKDTCPILVFSDQMDKAVQYLPVDERLIHTDEQDELVAFYTMVACQRGGIGLNSTFAWWAGFLNTNPSKKMYFPDRWCSRTNLADPVQAFKVS